MYTKAKTTSIETNLELNNRSLARKMGSECIVLLKNENNALPITNKNVALYGSGVKKTIYGGTGSGEVRARYYVSIYEGFINAGYNVTSQRWLNDYDVEFADGKKKFPRTIVKKFVTSKNYDDLQAIFGSSYEYPFGRMVDYDDVKESDTDVCCYVISRQSGEGKDKSLESFKLSKEEVKQIRFLSENYKKFILIINAGSYLDISSVASNENVNAIVYVSQLGEEMGNSVVDVLSGEVTPSGHLSDSWVKSYSDVYNGMKYSNLTNTEKDQNYEEGLYVGYRYYSSMGIKTLYPFGYGLSYTSFDKDVKKVYNDSSKIHVLVEVKNTGSTSGKEVVQLYLSAPSVNLPQPKIKLCSFKKSKLLQPKEKEILDLVFDLKDEASYDESNNEYVLEKGTYLLHLGENAEEYAPVAKIQLNENIQLEKGHILTEVKPTFEDLVIINSFEDVKVKYTLKLEQDDFLVTDVNKEVFPDYINEKISELTTNECVELLLGTGLKMFSFKEYFTVPGAVGNTTSKLVDKGIPNVALSDGPAGLRLMRKSVINGKKIKGLDSVFELINYIPNFVARFTKGNPKRGQVLYQYATAFPVCTAMAQSFNEELAIEEGYAISLEMQEYGVTFWLAPGVNIHRNPLCGRNYEYYSEDPYLTGRIASSVCKGIESIKGHYVTIKHFCCNNQEYKRNTSSSNVSDRVLREMYLRPYKIAIQDGNVSSLMTSYNQVNHVYPSTNKALITGFLREECGFNGVVMTDWMSTNKNFASSYKSIKAGNDLMMPGLPIDRKDILKAYKKGLLTEEEIRLSAKRILKAILESNFNQNK